MGLLEALTQYIKDAMPGGSLNPEQPAKLSGLLDAGKKQAQYIGGLLDPNSPISKDAQSWHKRTQIGLADQLAGRQTPEAEQAYQTMMQAAGIAPVGMIAWHGSPHKFDKFSLDKIGTGEGAQAYGHGLYLAEHPATAEVYASKLANGGAMPMPPTPKDFMIDGARYVSQDGSRFKQVGNSAEMIPVGKDEYGASLRKAQQAYQDKRKAGNLYKTDIPDEAVARFLDWDKKLSEQAPDVQKALGVSDGYFKIPMPSGRELFAHGNNMAGVDLIQELSSLSTLGNKAAASEFLKSKGIPGIRYLDGGSRVAGTGTSNFVSFSPEIIRILERNGESTGHLPWGPGEWKP